MTIGLKHVVSWILIGLFYILLWYSTLVEVLKKAYYDVFGIPYRTGKGKFHSYYVRLNK